MKIGKTAFRNRSTAIALVLFFALPAIPLISQQTWSLQECVEYARKNSLTLKQATYGIEIAKLTDKQNRMARLPNLNGSAVGGWQFGRTIDPTTNTFDNRTIGFNSMQLNAGMVLFSGGQINNSIKQGKIDVEAAEEDANATFNNLAINIANAYLQILMAEEQLENARKRLGLSQEQLDQTDKLIQAGTLPANDRLDVLAQIANDEQTIVLSRNQIDINYLNLKLLMQLDASVEMKIERPAVIIPADANPDQISFQETYMVALNTQPQIRAAELYLRSAEAGVDIARAGLMPTLTMFGGLDSRWSSASRILDSRTPTVINQTVFINGLEVQVGFPSEEFTFRDHPYFDQLQENFGKSFGLSLQVPIYNNHRNRVNFERAKVNILNTKVQADLTKQQLKNDVQQALANARAGRLSLEASEKASDAAQVAFENAEKRFRLGSINNLQLLTARNTFDIAQTNLIVAKYDYLFRLKILDFYLGKEMKLN